MKRFFSKAAQNEEKNINEVGINDLGTLEAEATSDWISLSEFKVTYLDRDGDHTTARVYYNGRQQVPIKILIQGRDENDQVVAIPPNDLAEMKLVAYNTGGELPVEVQYVRIKNLKYDYFPESLAFVAEGDETEESNKTRSEADLEWQRETGNMTGGAFLQVSGKVVSTDDGMETLAQEVSFWVTTTSTDTIRIAAKITKQGTVFHTHSPQAGPGLFDSSVLISPQRPVSHDLDEFAIRRRDEVVNDLFDVDIYEIYLKNQNLKIRDSIHYTKSGNSWHYSWEKSGSNKVHTAYKADHRRLVKFMSFMPVPIGGYVDFYVNWFLEDEGKATASRIIDKKGGPWNGGKDDWATVGYIDNFGNESKVVLAASTDGNGMYLDRI